MSAKDCNVPFNSKTECISSKYSPSEVKKLAQDCGIDTNVVKNKKDQCNELVVFISKKADNRKIQNPKISHRKTVIEKPKSADCNIPFDKITDCQKAIYKPDDVRNLALKCGVDIETHKTKKAQCTELVKTKNTKSSKVEEKKEEEIEKPKSADCNIPFDKITDCQKAIYKPLDVRNLALKCGVDIETHKNKKAQCTELVKTKKTQISKVEEKKEEEKGEGTPIENIKKFIPEIEIRVKKVIKDYLNKYINSTHNIIENISTYIQVETDKVLEEIFSQEDLADYKSWNDKDILNFVKKYSDIFKDYPIDQEKEKPKEQEQEQEQIIEDIFLEDIDPNLYNLRKTASINEFASIQDEILKCLRG